MDKLIAKMENLPVQEATRRSLRFWSDDYRHRPSGRGGNSRKGRTLRSHRTGR